MPAAGPGPALVVHRPAWSFTATLASDLGRPVVANDQTGAARRIGSNLLLSARHAAPAAATTAMRQILEIAVDGRGPFQGAVAVANKQRVAHNGDVVPAASVLIEQHVRLAGGQGFVTGLGGLATMVVALPANITSLAILQARLVASIAHLHGYDLATLKVRTAVVAMLLGEDAVGEQIRGGRLPSRPLAIATAPVFDPVIADKVLNLVGATMTTRLGGKHLGTTFARRIPLLGGGVGAVVDAVSTYQIGAYARDELPNRIPQIEHYRAEPLR